MNDTEFKIERAGPTDLEEALPVVRGFYDHFGFPWNEPAKRRVLTEVLAQPELGWLALVRGGEAVVGYVLVIFFLSLEFDGRVAVLDEFYLTPECRGQGVGGRVLREVARSLSAMGIRVVRLELDERHPEAAGLYSREGYTVEPRQIWSRRLVE